MLFRDITGYPDIDAGPTDVWLALVDVQRWPDWTESMTSTLLLAAGSWLQLSADQGVKLLGEGNSDDLGQHQMQRADGDVKFVATGQAGMWAPLRSRL
jgi:hypothetical protein